ncbi:hypothetical protein OSTOST_23563, partial [Ostertagia ostertagi]
MKSPDAEMWATIVKIARTDAAMLETATCVDQIESLLEVRCGGSLIAHVPTEVSLVGRSIVTEQPLSVDLSLYIRIPTIPTEGENMASANGTANHNKEKKMLLDQNNYLEERNRQLQCNVDNLKRKLSALENGHDKNAVVMDR